MSGSQKKGKKPAVAPGTLTLADLLTKTQNHIDEFQFDLARKTCARVLKVSPNNLQALELMGGILLEFGEIDQAIKRFEKCIQLSPNDGYSKYLTLGQIIGGTEGLQYYQKGILLLNQEKESKPDEIDELNHKISSAYCGMVEIYLTDLCDEPDAEQQCCNLSDEAEKADPTNPEVYQCKASIRISQTKTEEAKELINKSVDLWLGKDEKIPSYEFRLNTSQILIELEQYDKSVEVLESLLTEDDEVVRVWYLLGYTFTLMKERKAAEETLKKGTQLHKKLECEDFDILQHMGELLEECKSMEYKPEENEMEDDDEEDGDGDEWEDVESDEEGAEEGAEEEEDNEMEM